MSLFGSSLTSPSSGLTAANINTLIQETLNAQRGPIRTLTTRKDELNIKKAVYSDLKSKLSTFKGVIENLTSDGGDTVFDDTSVTSSDTDVLTATATSEAMKGTYSISNITLAKAHRVRSEVETSSAEALNLSGKFTLNGASITVGTNDSLQDIMDAINSANYNAGNEAKATIIKVNDTTNYLVIEAASTGQSNALTASDTTGTVLSGTGTSGLGIISVPNTFVTTSQPASNASFNVNGIAITRGSNTDLDDVIHGVTFNLLEDAPSGTVELEVASDYSAIRAKISAFVNNLNSTVSYLKSKTGTTVDKDKETYTRGALAGETIFSRLKLDLLTALTTRVGDGDPGYKYLENIGITVGDGLEVSLDETMLSSALESNFEGVVQLFNGVMEQYLYTLKPFTTTTSSSNTIDLYSRSVETRMENIGNRIERMEKMLEAREEILIKQYSGLYMRSMQIQNEQQNLFSIYSSFSAWG